MAVSRASTREHYLDAEIPQRNGPFGAAGYVADPAAGRATPTTLQESALRRVSIVEAEKRHELAQLQNEHVTALKAEIGQLREENGILAAALNNDQRYDHASRLHGVQLAADNERLRTDQGQLDTRLGLLQHTVETVKKEAQRETDRRIEVERQLADMVRRGNACKVEHGADDLLTRYGGGAGAGGDAADPTPGPGPSDWQSLLEETKVVQAELRTQDKARSTVLGGLRARAVAAGTDFEAVRDFVGILDMLQPRRANHADNDGLDRLLAIETRLHEAKTTRRQLEEHLAYLNQVNVEHEGGMVLQMGRHQNASELLSARVWELEHQNQEALQANLELHQQCRRHMEHRKELVELLDRDHRKTPDSASTFTSYNSDGSETQSTHSTHSTSLTGEYRSGPEFESEPSPASVGKGPPLSASRKRRSPQSRKDVPSPTTRI